MTTFEVFLLPEPITFPNRDSVPILPSATGDDWALEPPLKGQDLCISKQSLQFSRDEVCYDKQRLVFSSRGYTDCRACYIYLMKLGRLMNRANVDLFVGHHSSWIPTILDRFAPSYMCSQDICGP
jgi:hypothetical protein